MEAATLFRFQRCVGTGGKTKKMEHFTWPRILDLGFVGAWEMD